MKRTSIGIKLPSQRWSSRARQLATLGALALGLHCAEAQNAVSTFAGTQGTPGFVNAVGTAARFSFTPPSGVAADASGNLYVADAVNHVIRKITPAGSVTTFAGTANVSGNADGTGIAATFSQPQGIAVDGAGNVYVADTGNHAIRMITSAGVVTTLAGTAGPGVTVLAGFANGTGAAALFRTPLGLAADRAGAGTAAVNVYVADTQNNVIRQVVVATKVVTTLSGSITGASGNINGTTSATFFHPDAIVSDSTGANLYVADTFNNLIRKIVITTGPVATVSTLAGSGTAAYADGTGVAASFNSPAGIALDGSGNNVLVADTFTHTVRTISSGGISPGVVALYAGTANSSGTADGLAAGVAKFNVPSGIAFDSSTSSVYVVDTNNQTVRKISVSVSPSITTQPASISVNVGANATFTVAATGNPTVSYQWQRQPGGSGSFTNLSNDSTYSGATTVTLTVASATALMNGDIFQVVVSNGFGTAATSLPVTLTVRQAPVFTSATSANFTVGQAGTFNVTTTGSPAPTLTQSGPFPTWATFNTATPGLGVLSAPNGPQDTATYVMTFTATNSAGTATQTFTLAVATGPSITTNPSSQTVNPGYTTQFSVGATSNAGSPTYQWQYQLSAGAGFFTLSDFGQYSGTTTSTLTVSGVTAANNGYQFRAVVSSGVGTPATSTAATLTVTQAPTITSLNNAVFVEGQYGSFTVQAIGSPTPNFTLSSGSLPFGLSFNPANGTITGFAAFGSSLLSPYNLQFTATNTVYPDATQPFSLTVSPTALVPAFTTQPLSVSVALGQAVTFTVAVTGSPTPTIQWQRQAAGSFGFSDLINDLTFAGVTTTTLSVTNPTSGMSGDVYRAVAINSSGSTASSNASLTVVIGTTITTFAGQAGLLGSVDGIGTAARFNTPASIAVDTAGNLYVADSSNNVIRKITSGGVVTTLAGLAGSSGSIDGTGSAARFNAPSGVAVDSVGTVFVADTFNHTIRSISPAGVVTTVAGSPGNSGTIDGIGSAARFTYPSGVAADSSGNIYVADTSNHAIRRVQNGTVTTFAGTAGSRGNVDGFGSAARFAYPNSVAVDSSGNVYVADSFNHTIRKITAASAVTTLAGTAGLAGSTDGIGTGALFNQPMGVAVDVSGNVYVADTFNNTLRRIAVGGVTTTLAGTAGFSGSTDGIGNAARFNQPYSVAVDAANNIFVADKGNQTIRRSGTVTAPQIASQPQNQTVAVGSNVTFTTSATGAPVPTIFQWQRQAAGTSGFITLTNDGIYSGVTTASLTVTNVASLMNGDQFRVVISNLISPDAVTNFATLITGTAPVFTSATTATFQATVAGTFTLVASGTPSVVYSATGLPSWASLDTATGVINGTPSDTSGSPFTVTVTASTGISVSQTLMINVLPAVLPPTIATQPSGRAVDQGQSTTLSVTPSGTEPFSYQWRRNGIAIASGTSSTLSLNNIQPSSAGTYSVTVTNSAGAITSNGAVLTVNTVPTFAFQPHPQVALAGSTVTFSAVASGGTSFNYQWRKNGVAIAGATNSTLTLTGVNATDAGNYDVIVTNSLGSVSSSLAQLTIATAAVAPVITAQPASRAALAGTPVTLSVAASGVPAPTYQWRKNGGAIAGANNSTYVFGNVQSNDAGNYDVVIINSAGAVTTATAALRVFTHSYAGVYFGSFGSVSGNFAIYVRDDNTGVFLGYLPGSTAPVMSLNLTVNDGGQFIFGQNAIAAAAVADAADEPARAAALSAVNVSGLLGTDGVVSGTMNGGTITSFSGSRSSDTGVAQGVAGFYQAGAGNSGATAYTIASPAGQAFVVMQSGTVSDGGVGTVNSTGQVLVSTTRSSLVETITPSTGTITGTANGGVNASFTGGSDIAVARQRLVNISSRARVGTADSIAIAGFVISGEESKPVLIRAVGPTLALFGVTGTLASPKLDLFLGSTVIATNTGVATSTNAVGIAAAATQAGAFALGTSGADSAILITLAPGNYTAQVSSATGATGIALVEVYDLSTAAPGQKLLNISTRASAGASESTLIAGFVIPDGSAKRVLVRGVGPGLAVFGVQGVLTQLNLTLISNGAVVAQNANWTTSADAAAITAASLQVGAFGLAAGDAAMIVTLKPGNYTAQVVGAGTSTGVALIEVYELP